MILQALTQYYDALNARGEIDAPGWGRPKISYALQLRENGELAQVIPLLHEVEQAKRKCSVRARIFVCRRQSSVLPVSRSQLYVG